MTDATERTDTTNGTVHDLEPGDLVEISMHSYDRKSPLEITETEETEIRRGQYNGRLIVRRAWAETDVSARPGPWLEIAEDGREYYRPSNRTGPYLVTDLRIVERGDRRGE